MDSKTRSQVLCRHGKRRFGLCVACESDRAARQTRENRRCAPHRYRSSPLAQKNVANVARLEAEFGKCAGDVGEGRFRTGIEKLRPLRVYAGLEMIVALFALALAPY